MAVLHLTPEKVNNVVNVVVMFVRREINNHHLKNVIMIQYEILMGTLIHVVTTQ